VSAEGNPADWIPVYGTRDDQIPQRLEVIKQLSPEDRQLFMIKLLAQKVDQLEKEKQRQVQTQKPEPPAWQQTLGTICTAAQMLAPILDPIAKGIGSWLAKEESAAIAEAEAEAAALKNLEIQEAIKRQGIENMILELDKDLKVEVVKQAVLATKKAEDMAQTFL